jgi:hypothetical protein
VAKEYGFIKQDTADFRSLGETGLKRSGGIITEEFLTELKGTKGRKVFREMVNNDPIVGAVDLVIKNLIRQADWEVEAASEDNIDKRTAEFVDEALHDMEQSWEQLLSEIMTMIVYGWSFFEVVYKRRQGGHDPRTGSVFSDNRIGWQNFGIRSQDSLHEWDFDENGNLQAMVQLPPPNYRERRIPMEKALLFRTESHKGNPEGKSILRKAYRPWYFKKRIEEIEGIGLERDLNGIPVAWVPQRLLSKDADSDDKAVLDKVETLVQNVRNDKQTGLVLPLAYDSEGNKMFEFELLSTKGKRNFDTDKIVMRYNRTIAMSALADFIILGHDNVGSFALASSKTKVFSVAVGSYMDEIAGVINKFAIPKLLRLNGMAERALPKLTHGDVETVDLDQLAKFVKAMSKVPGFGFGGEKFANFLRQQLGLPPVSEEEIETEEEMREQMTPDNFDTGEDSASTEAEE